MNYGIVSIFIPIIVIALAVITKRIIPSLIVGILAGGALGDNTSPLGETAILSSTIADIPLMEHVRSQLPYSIAGIILSSVLFTVFAVV